MSGRKGRKGGLLKIKDVFVFGVVFTSYAVWRNHRFYHHREEKMQMRQHQHEQQQDSSSSSSSGGHGEKRLVNENEDREAFESSDEEPVDPSPPIPPEPMMMMMPPPPLPPPLPEKTLSPPPVIEQREQPEEGKEKEEQDEYEKKYTILPKPDQSNIPLNAQEVRSDSNHPQWMKDMWAQQTKALTEEAKKELERKIYEGAIPPELSHAKPGDAIFVTFATH